jgi:CheY-like chemotaxis protein
MDIRMPYVDGQEVTARFQAEPELKDIPIIYLTATVSQEQADAHRGIIGGHRCLAKPVGPWAVMRCIDQVVYESLHAGRTGIGGDGGGGASLTG